MSLSVRRLVPAVLVAFGAFLCLGATAFGAPPETPGPVTVGVPVGAAKVSVSGTLSPNAEGHPGTYEFLYNTSKTECKGGSRAPDSPGIALGFEHEEVSEVLTGLAPSTEYTVCLLGRNAKGEETVGPAKTFTTAMAVQAPATLSVSAITALSASLHGVLNPGGNGEAGSYEFLYRASSSECQGGGASGGSALGKEKEAVLADVNGLQPNTEYTYCLLARNEAGETVLSPSATFTTQTEKPSIGNESALGIGTHGALVSAQVDPNGLPATYHFEYGPTTAYGFNTAEDPVDLGEGDVTVDAQLAGLTPGAQYHFRVVATSAAGSELGSDSVFTVYPENATGLPDGRVYEIVTPPENYNADVYELYEGSLLTERLFQAAADGDAVAYVALPTTGGNGSTGDGNAGDEYLATRSAQGGWSQANITPAGSGPGTAYQGFSSDLSAGVLGTHHPAPLTTTDSLSTPGPNVEEYSDLYTQRFDENLYRPVFAGTPPYRKGEGYRGEFFGPPGSGSNYPNTEQELPVYAGSSGDLDDVLFEANGALLNGEGPPALESELDSNVEHEFEEATGPDSEAFSAVDDRAELYVSVAGRVNLVNVLPDGKLAPNSTFGGPIVSGTGHPEGEFERPDFSNVISEDGSHIFWTDLESGSDREHVFVRENGMSTVAVSEGAAQFWTATPDGRYAFYTEAGVLWRFDVEDGSRVQLAGGSGGVVSVVGVNEVGDDGAYVYLVSSEALEGAENDAGQKPIDGADNLYVYEDAEDGGPQTMFIGTLASGDVSDWSDSVGGRKAHVTPDGHGLAFTSSENLTGQAHPGEGGQQVYVYDADDSSLFCASCRPQASGGHFPNSASLVYAFRTISENGNEVFFDSSAPLVAQDVNGKQDVYEWERDGSGTCDEADGCVYLLSGGIEGSAFLVDASVNGSDVFFAARQKLAPEDGNEDVNLFDARVDGALPVAPPECTGTGCQGVPASAPIFATPASVTFAGVGNFPPPTASAPMAKPKSKVARCKKGYVKRKARCVRSPKAKKSAKTKRSSRDLGGK